jgi:hypothetical protein
VPETTQVVSEEVLSEYSYWKDQLWSPARVFEDVRWWARALISKKSLEKKFGKEDVPLAIGADPKDNTVPKTPWARAELWEIWDKENECQWWYVENHPRAGADRRRRQHNPDGSIPDPLGLSTFWPFPEPLFEGVTNSKLVPRPSYSRAQDQYAAIDDATTRIGLLRDAVDASCVYDKTVGELGELLNSQGPEHGRAGANYKALAEKGGIAACVSWKPLKEIVEAMNVLRDLRKEDIDLLFQVDGTSDIMRGQATEAEPPPPSRRSRRSTGASAGTRRRSGSRSSLPTRSASAARSSASTSPRRRSRRALQRGQPAGSWTCRWSTRRSRCSRATSLGFKIVVKAESVSLTDYAANKQESMDVVGMIGQFFQAVQPSRQVRSAARAGDAAAAHGVHLAGEGRRRRRADPRPDGEAGRAGRSSGRTR